LNITPDEDSICQLNASSDDSFMEYIGVLSTLTCV